MISTLIPRVIRFGGISFGKMAGFVWSFNSPLLLGFWVTNGHPKTRAAAATLCTHGISRDTNLAWYRCVEQQVEVACVHENHVLPHFGTSQD